MPRSADGDRLRLHLGDHGPLHGEMLQAVKAADVMMGNDPHCAAWIARNGDGAAAPRAVVAGARRDGARRHERAICDTKEQVSDDESDRLTLAAWAWCPIQSDTCSSPSEAVQDGRMSRTRSSSSRPRGAGAPGARHLGARRRPPPWCRPRLGVRWPGDLRRCQVTVAEGEHANTGSPAPSGALTPATETEATLRRRPRTRRGSRLGCTAPSRRTS